MGKAVGYAITHARAARGADDTCNDWLTDVAGGANDVPMSSLHANDSRLEPHPELLVQLCLDFKNILPECLHAIITIMISTTIPANLKLIFHLRLILRLPMMRPLS